MLKLYLGPLNRCFWHSQCTPESLHCVRDGAPTGFAAATSMSNNRKKEGSAKLFNPVLQRLRDPLFQNVMIDIDEKDRIVHGVMN